MATQRIDLGYDGETAIGYPSAAISGSGRYAVLRGDGLVALGLSGTGAFIRDNVTGRIEAVGPARDGSMIGDAADLQISGNGRYVVYTSGNANIVADDTNGLTDVFRYDRQTGVTIRIGGDAFATAKAEGISNDGNWISMTIWGQLYTHNVTTGETLLHTDPGEFAHDVGNIGTDGSVSFGYHEDGFAHGRTPLGDNYYNTQAADQSADGTEFLFWNDWGYFRAHWDGDGSSPYGSYIDAEGDVHEIEDISRNWLKLSPNDEYGSTIREMWNVELAESGRYVVLAARVSLFEGGTLTGIFVWDTYEDRSQLVHRLRDDFNLDPRTFRLGISADGSKVMLGHWVSTATQGHWQTDLIDNAVWAGGSGGDTYAGGSIHAATGGDDARIGSSDADTFSLGGGDDVMHGAAGDDHLSGGADDDRLFGDVGSDTLRGDDGDDTLFGFDADEESGDEDDADTLYGGAGDDLLVGGRGEDTLYGGADNDTLFGGREDDALFGGDGADELVGDDGDDILDGGEGDDSLWGGEGEDALKGGEGNDELFGDEGSDDFWLDAGDDYIDGGTDPDGTDQDVIYLSGSAADYGFDDGVDAQYGAYTLIESAATGSDTVQNVEWAEFDHLRTNVASVQNLYLTLAQAANTAYDSDARMGDGWAAVSALELGVPITGVIEGVASYTFQNGNYTAIGQSPLGDGLIEANAQIHFGVVDGRNTLMIAFRGTDDIANDGQDYPNMALHYQRFEPLVKALLSYVESGGHTPDGVIDQVYVTGHSLGGGVAQMFMQDPRVMHDPRFVGATFGSPGAESSAFDGRMLHFEHSGDPVPLAADLGRALATTASANPIAMIDSAFFNGDLVRALNVLPGSLGFHTAGGVVRMSTDATVANFGLPQHSMDTYVDTLTRLAAQADRLPFMQIGTGGLPASGHANVVVGTAGDDRLSGAASYVAQVLRGLNYFNGDEVVLGGRGQDTMTGGGGRNVFAGTAEELNADVITDMAGGDVIRLWGVKLAQGDIGYQEANGTGVLTLGQSAALVLHGRHFGTFTIGRSVDGPDGYTDIVYTGGWGWLGSGGADAASGGEGLDVLEGGSGDDVLSGGAGDDTLIGGSQAGGAGLLAASGDDDLLDGGIGADTMKGGVGNDRYVVDDAGDTVIELAGEGYDAVTASISYTLGDHVERLDLTGSAALSGWGNALANTLVGNAGANALYGGAGADVLQGGLGDDRLDGGAGADVYRYASMADLSAASTADAAAERLVMTVGDRIDLGRGDLVFTGAGAFVGGGQPSVRQRAGAGLTIVEVDANGDGIADHKLAITGTVQLIEAAPGVLAFWANSVVRGTDAGEALTGTARDDVIEGLGGHDHLLGNGGDDALFGGAGDDRIDGGTGADRLFGGTGNDIYVVDSARDTIVEKAGEGHDTVESAAAAYTLAEHVEDLILVGGARSGTGNAGANLIVGNALDNVLHGEAGEDVLRGGDGTDRLFGGDGDDTLDGGAGADVMTGGSGSDLYIVDDVRDRIVEDWRDFAEDEVRSTVSFSLASGVERLVLLGDADLAGTGNDAGNLLVGNAGANVLSGLNGADTIRGGDGADVLDGGDGSDWLAGDAGKDRLIGRAGMDWLDGGAGADVMVGGRDGDHYVVDDARDRVVELAGEGYDTVKASVDYTLAATAEIEVLEGTGEIGLALTGNAIDNMLIGTVGADRLSGGAGDDTLYGNDGRDVLIGGAGADYLSGGAGADIFLFTELDLGAVDIIGDFSRAERDRINLSRIDADTTSAGDQAFTFVGEAAFSGSAGELRWEVVDGRRELAADRDGDGAADFTIVLQGTEPLAASDFLL